MRTFSNPVIRSAFASKLGATLQPLRRAAIEATPAHIRANPHLDPELGVPKHVAATFEDNAERPRGAHLKDGVFHVRSWLLRRDAVNAYNLLTDDEIRSALARHDGYVRGTVRTLAAIYDAVVI